MSDQTSISTQSQAVTPTNIHRMQGLYFEQFIEGLTIETRARTITESDIVTFAGLSGDYNPMHTDAESAKNNPFGARIAHGALIFSIATGLLYQSNVLENTVLAFRGFEVKLSLPTYIGDTIRAVATVKEKKLMRGTGGGLVTLEVKVTNQKNETIQRGEWVILMKSDTNLKSDTKSKPAT